MKKTIGLLLGALMLGTSVYAGSEYFDAGQKLFDAGVTTLSPYYTAYDAGLQRFEAALLINRFAEKVLDRTAGAGVGCDYVDNRQLGSSNSIEISASCGLGLFKGGQYFNPYNSFTRGQLIIVLARLLSNDPSKELDSAYNYLLGQSVITVDDRIYAGRVSPRSELYIMLGRIMDDNAPDQTNDISDQIQNIIDTVDDTSPNQGRFDTHPDHTIDNNQSNNTPEEYPDLIITNFSASIDHNALSNYLGNAYASNRGHYSITIKNNSSVDVETNKPDGGQTKYSVSCVGPAVPLDDRVAKSMYAFTFGQEYNAYNHGEQYLIRAGEEITLEGIMDTASPDIQIAGTRNVVCTVGSDIRHEVQSNNAKSFSFTVDQTSEAGANFNRGYTP